MKARTKNEKYPSPAHQGVDLLLVEWGQADQEVKQLEAYAAAALAEVQQEWAGQIQAAKYKRDALGAAIKDTEKEHHSGLFGDAGPAPVSCSVDLPHGTLLYDKAEYVVKPRKVDVLANLKAQDLQEGIRVEESVDWDILATWTDDQLALVGTRCEVKETYGFQIKESRNEAVGAVSQGI